MALQRINWTQIDTANVPTGLTINLGQQQNPLDSVHAEQLTIEGVDFFDYLSALGYTGNTPNTVYAEDNGGILVTHEATGTTLTTTYNTSLDSSLSTPNTVGGIPAGTTVSQLTGKTFVQFVDDLLFPVVYPTYTIPTISMTGSPSGTAEIGSTLSPSINAFGIKNDGGIFSQLRILRNGDPILTDTSLVVTSESNIPNQFGYPDPNNPNFRYSITSPYVDSYVIPYSSYQVTTTYQVDGNYGQGLPKQDNKGNFDTRSFAVRSLNAPQSASTGFLTSSSTVTAIIPYFWGTSMTIPTALSIASAIEGGTSTKVLSSASGTLSIPYNNPSTWLYIWFAYPSNNSTKTKWWVNALDNGDINGSFISTVVTQGVNSPEGYNWSGMTFKMHWSVYQTQQNTIEFRNN